MKSRIDLYMSYLRKLTSNKLIHRIILVFLRLYVLLIGVFDKILIAKNLSRSIRKNISMNSINLDEIELHIGILIKDRPAELFNLYSSIEPSLDNLGNKVHITLFDDNSTDLTTQNLIKNILSKHNDISLIRRHHSDNSWSSSHNWAVENLIKKSDSNFDIIGTIDSDMVLSNNWCDVVKKSIYDINYISNLPVQYISIFNSDDKDFHKWKEIIEIGGTKYVIKLRMGGATIFFSKKNYLKFKNSLHGFGGKHLDNLDDESRMTRHLLWRGIYFASTFESYAEHFPSSSLLDARRKISPRTTKALNLRLDKFSPQIQELMKLI